MDIYKVLYDTPIDYVESGDIIQFKYLDDDLVEYTEQLHVESCTYDGDGMFYVYGFSDYFNDKMEYPINEDEVVSILGG